MRNNKAVTLLALVITIIILILLAGTTIHLLLGENGILNHAKQGKEETNIEIATEIINFKITTAEMNTYAQRQEMPTLKELSNILKEDEEIQYVLDSSRVASAEYNVKSENPESIYTKLWKYPYEFEINSSLQLASVDGKKVTSSTNIGYPINIKRIRESDKNTILSYSEENKIQQYLVPEDGYYKIECWGASGGNAGSAIGGKGAYTSGIIYLAKNEEIWGYIGEAGKDGGVSGEYSNGTFNGGGSCGSTNAWGNLSTGGGATDIRLVNGDWDNFDSLKSRIMVAGGGGGASRMLGSSWLNINGGHGGTIIGESSNSAVTNRCYLYQSNWWNSNIGRTICQ